MDTYDNNTVQKAIEALQRGELILISDDTERENEGDLVMAGEMVTQEKIAFIVKHTSGIIVIPMTKQRLEALNLPLMVENNTDPFRTAFTVSVDYKYGTTTGMSASDRAKTIKALADDNVKPSDFSRPGHIFPLQYTEGGVLKRAGHTEASIDLLKMANMKPVATICEVINDKGEKASGKELEKFSKEHGILKINIKDIIKYRLEKESLVERVEEALLPTSFGEFTVHAFRSLIDNTEHLALVKGEITNKEDILVRVHSECLTGDILSSLRCDCGQQLHQALKMIQDNGNGILVYLRGHEGRGIGLAHKIRAYNLQDKGLDTVEANEALGFLADSRDYGIGSQILRSLGITSMHLMTNNPHKYGGIEGFGLKITKRIPISIPPTKENYNYLQTKKIKLGHLLETT
jgi:3,4-dihydroxy 2-butanone 4-phosphate synthase / GTP cyclohydrolase II